MKIEAGYNEAPKAASTPPLASVVERCARSKLRRPDSGMVSPVTDHRVKLP
jgi:hypothetical protein